MKIQNRIFGNGLLTALVVALIVLGAGDNAWSRVNVVTLPARDSVQLTIYNSVDLTLVKETRLLTFRKGMNRLEFSWANTLIDPTSVEFRALSHADEVDVIDVSFPPRVTNTLEWRIRSEVAGEVEVEIRYFTSGIRWSADYVAEAVNDEKTMSFDGYVRVTNNSGEDYENAQVRLVVGVVRLVEEIAQLARQSMKRAADKGWVSKDSIRARFNAPMADAFLGQVAQAEEDGGIVKEGLSEYFLYTVGTRNTIPNGWSKRLPSFNVEDVPITSFYKYEKERFGERVMRYYRFKNDEDSELGTEPLPDGAVNAFRNVSDDDLYSFVGRTSVKYIPIDEQVDMELGNDREVMVKPVLRDWQKIDVKRNGAGNVNGYTLKESWSIEVQNSRNIPVTLDIRRNFGGDWELSSDSDYEKMDASKVKFELTLEAGEKRTVAYLLTTRHGVNVTK